MSWMAGKGFRSLGEVRGMLAVPAGTNGSAHEQTGYVSALRAANAGAYGPW